MTVLVPCIIAVMLYAGYAEHKEWQAFKVSHACKVVGKTSATTGTGISSSGNVVVVTNPGQTGWLCDDGVTYWR